MKSWIFELELETRPVAALVRNARDNRPRHCSSYDQFMIETRWRFTRNPKYTAHLRTIIASNIESHSSLWRHNITHHWPGPDVVRKQGCISLIQSRDGSRTLQSFACLLYITFDRRVDVPGISCIVSMSKAIILIRRGQCRRFQRAFQYIQLCTIYSQHINPQIPLF